MIIDLQNKDTSLKQEVMPQSIGIIANEEITYFNVKDIIDANSSNYQEKYNILKKWIYKKRNNIFNFLPTSFPNSDNFEINIERYQNSKDTILVNISNYLHYENGKLISNGISPSFKISGFSIKNTSLKTNTIPTPTWLETKAPYEVNNLDITNTIIENQNILFHELVEPLNNSNIDIKLVSITYSGGIDVVFVIPAFVNGEIRKNLF